MNRSTKEDICFYQEVAVGNLIGGSSSCRSIPRYRRQIEPNQLSNWDNNEMSMVTF
jgi:hypothetical protein